MWWIWCSSILIDLTVSSYLRKSSNGQDKHRKLHQVQKFSEKQIALSSKFLWMLHGFSLNLLAACFKSKIMNWLKLRGQAPGNQQRYEAKNYRRDANAEHKKSWMLISIPGTHKRNNMMSSKHWHGVLRASHPGTSLAHVPGSCRECQEHVLGENPAIHVYGKISLLIESRIFPCTCSRELPGTPGTCVEENPAFN